MDRLHLQTKNLVGDDIAEQTDQALKNLGAILGKGFFIPGLPYPGGNGVSSRVQAHCNKQLQLHC